MQEEFTTIFEKMSLEQLDERVQRLIFYENTTAISAVKVAYHYSAIHFRVNRPAATCSKNWSKLTRLNWANLFDRTTNQTVLRCVFTEMAMAEMAIESLLTGMMQMSCFVSLSLRCSVFSWTVINIHNGKNLATVWEVISCHHRVLISDDSLLGSVIL